MEERYSVLRPLKMEELERIVFDLIAFFSPLRSQEVRAKLGKNVDGSKILPLSVNDFVKYMEQVKGIKEFGRYHYHILALVKKLEQSNFLCKAGKDTGFTMGGENCYYCIKELSNLQSKNPLWIGECLGLEYIQYRTKDFVVPITGIDSTGGIGIGTGTLINENTILTCEHVLTEMKVDDEVRINKTNIKVLDVKPHSKVDVGIIKLDKSVDLDFQMVFGEVYLLDEILTMGYPPVPMTRDAYLISQKGEINSLVKNYDGIDHIIYSSITRPGNSGGPIFTKRGHLVGISARQLEREHDSEKNVVPFFEGIPSCEIIKALKEIEPDIKIAYENYQ
ncbi:MAG: trypsin-like peptidase domain-containing protein [Clostridia bacterium]|nr:trypsin-like peptidase domain-containing protein [Clostridia bacterium]